jgi:hypothetical protein
MNASPASATPRGPLYLGLALTLGACVRPLAAMTTALGDNDDAMRLQAVRDLLNGQNWFDLVQHRMAPPLGLESHWSRLVDAPLATLIGLTTPILGQANAEFFVRAIWPPALFLLALWAVTRAAYKFGGERAAWAAAVMGPLSGFIWMQFVPGRIDHHCAQLAIAAVMLLASMEMKAPRSAALIGALAAVSAAIGLESIGVIAWAAMLYFALLVLAPSDKRAVRAFSAAFAGVGTLAYLIQTPPAWLFRTGCDALQLNGLAGIVLAGAGLALATYITPKSLALRAGLAGGVGAFAGAVALGLHPSCLHGPYADIDPRIVSLWLPDVEEASSWWSLVTTRPIMGLSGVTLPFAGLAIAAWKLRRGERDIGFRAVAGLLLISTAVGMGQARGLACATLVAVPLVAMWLASLKPMQAMRPRLAGVLAGAVMSPTLLYQGLMLVTPAKASAVEAVAPAAIGCTQRTNFEPLQHAPKGIVFGDLNIDAHILANTPQAVAGGPYHRLGQPISDGLTAFLETPDKGGAVIARSGADYVALCRLSNLPEDAADKSLANALLRGPAPVWASPMNEQNATVAIFRVNRSRLPQL